MIDQNSREQVKNAIGANIYRLRKIAEMRQDELAEKIGISRIQLNRLENGHSEPSATILFAIADALEVTADYLRQIPINAT